MQWEPRIDHLGADFISADAGCQAKRHAGPADDREQRIPGKHAHGKLAVEQKAVKAGAESRGHHQPSVTGRKRCMDSLLMIFMMMSSKPRSPFVMMMNAVFVSRDAAVMALKPGLSPECEMMSPPDFV